MIFLRKDKKMEYLSHSPEESIELGKKIAQKLHKNQVILLCGDLGAGKTKLTEGILTYFGLENEISSPTFAIVNEYNTDSLDIFHFDLYRLEDIDEFLAIGGEEFFTKGASLIEWGELIEPILPKDYIKITINKSNEDENLRTITIDCFGNEEMSL